MIVGPEPRADPPDHELERIGELWARLSRAAWTPRPGESVVDRLETAPWESLDPCVREAWEALTDPANLAGLERWAAGDLNPVARRATDKALQVCRERASRWA